MAVNTYIMSGNKIYSDKKKIGPKLHQKPESKWYPAIARLPEESDCYSFSDYNQDGDNNREN